MKTYPILLMVHNVTLWTASVRTYAAEVKRTCGYHYAWAYCVTIWGVIHNGGAASVIAVPIALCRTRGGFGPFCHFDRPMRRD